MKKLYFLSVLLIALIGCSTGEVKEKTPQELSDLYTDMGTSSLLRGEFPKAVEDLRKALKLNPVNAVARAHLGLAYFSLGRKQEGKAELQRSVIDDPKYSDGFVNLGSIAAEEKNYTLAKHYYKKALENLEYKYRHRALTSLSQVYFQEGNLIDAKFYLQQSLTLNPDYCQSNFLSGSISMREKNYSAANISFKKSVSKLCAGNLEGVYQLGLSYYRLKQFQKAKQQFMSLIENNPQSMQAQAAGNLLKEIP